eukprot:11191517-Lingulodinium_polyedra.AAC.1
MWGGPAGAFPSASRSTTRTCGGSSRGSVTRRSWGADAGTAAATPRVSAPRSRTGPRPGCWDGAA